MAAAPPSRASVAAVEAASDLGYLLKPLHWVAIMRHPRSPAGSAPIFRLSTLVFATICFTFFCSQIVVMCREGTADLDVFTLTLSVADTTAIWLVRLLHIAVRERDFQRLALQVGQDFAEFLSADDVPVLLARGRTVRRFTLTYISLGVAFSACWLVSPVSPDGLPFILALPYDVSTTLGYAVTWVYCTVDTVHVVVMTMVFDSFNISLIAQLRMQLSLLNRKIVSLGKENSSRPLDSLQSTDYRDLYYRLEKCVLHHQAIIRNADLLERCLSGMLLGQSISIGSVACFQMFQVALSADGMQQIGKFGFYLFAMLAELFIYCWFGDDLITESENLALAAYDAVTSLQGCPLSIKKSLMLLMNRAQRPLRITAGGFFPLSRESFVAVVNVSYSFFAILRNFKDEQE
ncbi:odorant receptor Or2-like [Schistocerca piceifrons]|uniref:odorant receptor Or2-like n=1 Tax=Schistocerca piceifrons TaxID=274613 RepID=UPI001F5F2031|nr:odorant receptor Or2-like [Schistocerca piceifrons]